MIAAVIAIADLCAQPAPQPEQRDVDDAAAYARAGDGARATGDPRTAVLAYRKASALDPDNTHVRDALAELCVDVAPDERSLLAAIALFRAGELDDAHTALAAIAADPGAHFFLGLIALRHHDGGDAVRELELAAREPAYADAAAPMLRLAHRDGAIAALLIAEPELDSNPQLVPDTPPLGATLGPPRTDESLLLAATLTARPWRWLAVRDVIAWRKQRELSTLDFFGETAQASIELDHRADHVAIRYDFDDDLLDGTSYLIANKAAASYRRELGAVALAASYSLRHRTFEQSAESGFTGWVHAADAGAVVHASVDIDVELRAIGWRELTADPAFSDVAGGGQLAVRARPDGRVRLTGTLAGWYAVYDGAEPDGTLRRDTQAEAGADVEIDLGDHVLAVGGASVVRNASTVEDFRYWKLVARAGVAFAFGGP